MTKAQKKKMDTAAKEAGAQKSSVPAIGTLSTIEPESISVSALPPQIGRFDGLSLTLADNISYADWKAVGVGYARIHSVSGWVLGDWLNAGAQFDNKEGKKAYKEAIEATGIDYQRLRTFASVAGRFKPGLRRKEISFEHHRVLSTVKDDKEVAALMDKVQNEHLSATATRVIVPKSSKTAKKLTPEQERAKAQAHDERMREKAQEVVAYLSKDIPAFCTPTWVLLTTELRAATRQTDALREQFEAMRKKSEEEKGQTETPTV